MTESALDGLEYGCWNEGDGGETYMNGRGWGALIYGRGERDSSGTGDMYSDDPCYADGSGFSDDDRGGWYDEEDIVLFRLPALKSRILKSWLD